MNKFTASNKNYIYDKKAYRNIAYMFDRIIAYFEHGTSIPKCRADKCHSHKV